MEIGEACPSPETLRTASEPLSQDKSGGTTHVFFLLAFGRNLPCLDLSLESARLWSIAFVLLEQFDSCTLLQGTPEKQHTCGDSRIDLGWYRGCSSVCRVLALYSKSPGLCSRHTYTKVVAHRSIISTIPAVEGRVNHPRLKDILS